MRVSIIKRDEVLTRGGHIVSDLGVGLYMPRLGMLNFHYLFSQFSISGTLRLEKVKISLHMASNLQTLFYKY